MQMGQDDGKTKAFLWRNTTVVQFIDWMMSKYELCYGRITQCVMLTRQRFPELAQLHIIVGSMNLFKMAYHAGTLPRVWQDEWGC